jgi:hypothetical protein
MYECLYGYTPFACEDRHNTKLKILKHKQTLKFPECDPTREPSISALDLMQALLVEKEKRLCSKRYELNDFSRRFIGGQSVKYSADKSSKHYSGLFVYADDADDIKRHAFFRNIKWESMLERRPPFVPRVKDWEDTKYFDEDQPVSDIESGSSDDIENMKPEVQTVVRIEVGSKTSHQHEDQHIVPSAALKLNANQTVLNVKGAGGEHIAALPMTDLSVSTPAMVDAPTKQKKERKRPRDKILRDGETGRTAMKMREQGAFLGYAYQKPKAADEVIGEVMVRQQETIRVTSPSLGYWTQPVPREGIF